MNWRTKTWQKLHIDEHRKIKKKIKSFNFAQISLKWRSSLFFIFYFFSRLMHFIDYLKPKQFS